MTTSPDPYEAEAVGLPVRIDRQQGMAEESVEMLADRFLNELRAGKQPTVEGYVERHPGLADEIRRLFPMIAALEGWKIAREPTLLRESVPESAVIERLGKYRCLRQIGKGGMGIVLEGEQIATGRRVAIKVPPLACRGGLCLAHTLRTGSPHGFTTSSSQHRSGP